jgi:peptidoglycan/LPS O-acetylase OafA/YrhL
VVKSNPYFHENFLIGIVMKAMGRQNNFNLLRLILASLVILSHSASLIDGDGRRDLIVRMYHRYAFGELAVDGFFLLSGYLIMQSWDTQPYAWQFLKKRVLRIYPGFIVVSLICAFVVGPLGAIPSEYFAAFDAAELLRGIVFLQKPVVPDVFSGQPYPSVNGSLWTISREFTCYMLILVFGVSGALRVRHLWAALSVVVLASVLAPNLIHVPWIDPRDLRVSSFFLSGGCFYIYREYIRFDGRLAAICTALICVCMFSWRAADLALPTIGGYALLYAGTKHSALLSNFNRLPDVSYGVYLYGWPIQKTLLWHFPITSPWLLTALALTVALVLGMASWFAVEKPALRLKGRSLPAVKPESEARPI